MRIVVTGAGGYVGAGLCSRLMERGDEVVMLDNFFNSQVREVGGERIIWADIRRRDEIEGFIENCDLVIHLAAISGVADCNAMPDKAYEVNVVGTANVCWACRKHGVNLIFPSSMSVIGNPVEVPVTSAHPRNPLNMYGFTKWVNEETIKAFSKNSFKSIVFVKTNLYGEYEVDGKRVWKRTVINLFVDRARRGEKLIVHKPGTQTRDFVHVLDVIDAYLKAIDRIEDIEDGEAYFTVIGGGECLSILDIAKTVQKYADVEIELVENPRNEAHAENFEVDVEEAKKLIGFQARRKVEDEIRKLLGV